MFVFRKDGFNDQQISKLEKTSNDLKIKFKDYILKIKNGAYWVFTKVGYSKLGIYNSEFKDPPNFDKLFEVLFYKTNKELEEYVLSHNVYIYALNNPIAMLDNNGKFAIAIALKVVAAIAVAVTGYYVAKKTVETVGVGVINTLTNPYLNFPKPSFNITAPTHKSQEASKSTTKDNVKVEVKPILPQAPSVEQTQPCTTATFTPDMTNILRGERLTINESVNYIKTGGNVMCDSQQSAFAVASNFPSFIGPEINKNKKLGFTYYPHYHPDRYSHRHIWFYPTSN